MDNLKHLLEKFERGTLSSDELLLLKDYFQSDEYNDLYQILESDWNSLDDSTYHLNDEASSAIWHRINRHKQTKSLYERKRSVLLPALSLAAIMLLLISVAFFGKIKPGSDQPQLVEKINHQTQPQYLTLSDGSEVWLNKGSFLSFHKPFSGDIRKVILRGEAFFKVKEDTKTPFVVESENIRTSVLGTSFNISAYPNKEQISVTLVEGKVLVETLEASGKVNKKEILSPGQQFVLTKKDRGTDIRAYKEDLPYAWKNSIVHFDGDDIWVVKKALEEWYDVELIIPEGLETKSKLVHRFNAKEQSIEDVLEIIGQVTDYYFEPLIDKNNAYVVKSYKK